MFYDYEGNTLISDGLNLNGYKMETPPLWINSKLVVVNENPSQTGTLANGNSNLCASDYIPVMGANSLIVYLPVVSDSNPVKYGLCFYDKDKTPLPLYGTNTFYNRQNNGALSKKAEVFIPKKAAYFRTTYWSDTFITSNPSTPGFDYEFTPGIYKAITNEIPANKGIENAIRRVRQLTDIEWTPLVNVPRYCLFGGDYSHQPNIGRYFLDWFKNGEKYTGIPYSGAGGPDVVMSAINPNTYAGQWGYIRMCLGIDIPFETFVTASRYANSVMGVKQNQSAPSFESSIYGTFCTGLVWYALGRTHPIPGSPGFVSNTNLFSLVCNVTNFDLSAVKVGDILQTNGHVAIITDIMRGNDDNVIAVEVSESITAGNGNNSVQGGELGGKCVRQTWALSDFVNWFQLYKIYRYHAFTDLTYEPSKYVNTGNEGNRKDIVDLPCIPFLGNKSTYHVGYIVNTKILIGATGFTSLVVMKDGEAFGTFDITGLTEVSVGFSAVGSYSAYLTKSGGVKTMSCEWTVEN